MNKRVVITGLGGITPIGNNVEEFWQGIKSSKCGIDKITLFDTSEYKVKIAGEVKGFNPDEVIGKKEAKRLDRFSQFAIVAAKEALMDSKITADNTDMTKVSVIIGSGIGGLKTIEDDNRILVVKGPDRMPPMYIPMSIVNMAARKCGNRNWSKRRSTCYCYSMC